jgi:hypothetical protein
MARPLLSTSPAVLPTSLQQSNMNTLTTSAGPVTGTNLHCFFLVSVLVVGL